MIVDGLRMRALPTDVRMTYAWPFVAITCLALDIGAGCHRYDVTRVLVHDESETLIICALLCGEWFLTRKIPSYLWFEANMTISVSLAFQ